MEEPSAGIKQVLQRHETYGIDTMAFIYHFENNPTYTLFTKPLFQVIEAGKARGVTSTLSVMEILVKPKEIGNISAAEDYKYVLTNFPNLRIRNLDLEVAEKAAEIRAKYHLRPPDAIQIGTALVEDADAFITNDSKLKRVDEIEIIVMKDLVETNRKS